MERVEEVSIVKLYVTLLSMQLQTKQEHGGVHHAQLRLIVAKSDEAFPRYHLL